ncbi:hypothetical protein AJ80_08995 [Polytolypa hystricis UAMH7299]|uniref:Glutamine amidotransferase type-2 domain-containing protein n=1 Tax=Polytolypa hystricis (strain UAMH7299) TaxID=1447883 RepID=A0A2B7WY82_POLH7|nr:hypothetical protein AJ80_08995 [Polytolypa hystricis UAMH7299]
MCGIFFSLSTRGFIQPDDETTRLLQSRGPDSFQIHSVHLGDTEVDAQSVENSPSSLYLTYISTVLSLRGDHVQVQPLVDPSSKSVLCWNGEAWKTFNELVNGNDAQHIFQIFLRAFQPDTPLSGSESTTSSSSTKSDQESLKRLSQIISGISGPFSFVFYDGFRSRVFYGRDYLGRRALMSGWDSLGNFKICSVCDGTSSTHFEEVGTNGIHMIDIAPLFQDRTPTLAEHSLKSCVKVETIPWKHDSEVDGQVYHLKSPIPPMNKVLPSENTPPVLSINSPSLQTLERTLRQSIELRVQNIPTPPNYPAEHGAKVAVLFSGGLDCTILARLVHDFLPREESIDLLNVAFENPRVAAAAAKLQSTASLSIYEECPDRKTGRSSHAELQRVCPSRHWRFVAINVPYAETLEHRDRIKRLMRPHNTEMDLSIACALYFASRGQGEVSNPSDDSVTKPYTTSARVLLSGLGADELFAGYSRHGVAFNRDGFPGLIDEIDLDVSRLGKRNLGRDDRVISHCGREARFPFLDEDFMACIVRLPVWEKCGFGTVSRTPTAANEDVLNEEAGDNDDPDHCLDSEKKALRLLAWKLGMQAVAREKKRAIQFGSRTAKMESGRTRGTQVLT